MKRYLLAALFVLISTVAFATPFVTCDTPPASENVIGYDLKWDNAATPERAAGVPLMYDLGGFANGRHDLQIRAVAQITYTGDDGSVTTSEAYSAYVPWGFVKTGQGGHVPGNIKLTDAELR